MVTDLWCKRASYRRQDDCSSA